MAHRVQLSLQIVDDELYTGFIEELKANRELNNKVINVLKAYYYDKESRAAIENYLKGDSIPETYDTATNTDELFADIRNAMAMSNFYANEATQTLEDGTDMVDDILHQTSKQAQDDGVIDEFNASEYGYEIPKLLTNVDEKKVKNVAKRVQRANNSDSVNEPFLEKLVLKLCDMVGLDPNSVLDDTTNEVESDNLEKETNSSDNLVRPEPEKPIVKDVVKETEKHKPIVKDVVKETETEKVKSQEAEIKNEEINNVSVTEQKEEEENEFAGFESLMESLASLDI